MSKNELAYVELPATSTVEMKAFYGGLFGGRFRIGARTTRPFQNLDWRGASMRGMNTAPKHLCW